jgi:hypothetical protein
MTNILLILGDLPKQADYERIGECDCCGKQKPLNFITTPLGHKTWECKECTVEWDGDSDGFNEQAGGY